MNVLLLHNRYREPGGEERSVGAIARCWRAAATRSRCSSVERASSAAPGAARRRGDAGAAASSPARSRAAVRRHRRRRRRTRTTSIRCSARARCAAARRAGRARRHAPAQLPARVRDRDRVPRRRGLHALPRPQHAGRACGSAAAATCREAVVYGAGLALPAAARARGGGPVRRAERVRARRGCAELGVPASTAWRCCPTSCAMPSSRRRRRAASREHALFAGRLVEEKGVDDRDRGRRRGRRAARDRGRRAGRGRPAGARAAARRDRCGSWAGSAPESWRSCARGAAFARRAVALGRAVPVRGDRGDGGGCAGAGVARGRPARDASAPSRCSRRATSSAGRTAMLGALERLRRCGARAGAAALARARQLFGEERFYSGLMDVYEPR